MSRDARPASRLLRDAGAVLATVRIAARDDPPWMDTPWIDAAERRPDDIHPAEWLEAEVLTDPARRRQWLAGRRAAKEALAGLLGVHRFEPGAYAIRSRDRFGRPARPTVWSGGRVLDVHLSVSHGERVAAALVSRVHRVGVDVVDARDGGAPDPRALDLHTPDPHGLDAWSWSAREAAYKVGPGDHEFVPEDWQVERQRRGPSAGPGPGPGRAIHRRPGSRPIPVRWLDDVPGAHVVAVCWRPGEPGESERSAA